jgi:hypothetical protein
VRARSGTAAPLISDSTDDVTRTLQSTELLGTRVDSAPTSAPSILAAAPMTGSVTGAAETVKTQSALPLEPEPSFDRAVATEASKDSVAATSEVPKIAEAKPDLTPPANPESELPLCAAPTSEMPGGPAGTRTREQSRDSLLRFRLGPNRRRPRECPHPFRCPTQEPNRQISCLLRSASRDPQQRGRNLPCCQ